MSKANPTSTTRELAKPYAIFTNSSGWEWRVLKSYKGAKGEQKGVFARWYCAVKSPLTHGGYDYGDVYISEILSNACLQYASDAWQDKYSSF